MNTIDKIRAEIERRKKYQLEQFNKKKPDGRPNDGWAESLAIMGELEELLSFLDTLEAETSYDTLQYNPSPSVDIGDVARVQFASHAKVFDKKRKAVFDWEQFKEVAGIFYGFGQRNNTLSEEPVSDCHDLEEAADDHIRKVVDAAGHPGWDWETQDIADAFKAGAEWQKAKMMEGAVEGYVNYYEDSGGILMAEAQVGCPYHNGDKVKIIIVKEEEQ